MVYSGQPTAPPPYKSLLKSLSLSLSLSLRELKPQEMMQCPDPSSSSVLSVLETQRAGLQWQPSFQTVDDEVNFTFDSLLSPPNSVLSLQDEEYPLHELGNGWPNLPNGSLLGCSAFPRHQSLDSPSASSLKSSRERKAVKPPMLVGNSAEKDKRIKVVTEEKPNEQSKGETKPENLKNDGAAASPQPPPKQEFIHVRARRGQATDSHSLAERVRRERISERMKYLQGLVPGCDKITGKAGMLDEIINYVQALQRQVEFLSMKLAAVNPWIDFNFDSFFLKELNMVGNLIIPTMEPPKADGRAFIPWAESNASNATMRWAQREPELI
ncbi:hypothetical protein HPP92_004900 [Vanilla planifolia]|uniref:BHLH domain-containing protein n=1 Tax=Vanilla planifolia TaxID=51239 RepID=A0A835RT02_VANPL|nr:hypothetical protein HPP92_004900 [Vanilla planifolia]